MNRPLAALALALFCTAASAPSQPVSVQIDGLRSAKGTVMICVTRKPAYFPDCRDDPDPRRYSVPASRKGPVALGLLSPGDYAVTVVHDENDNRKLDKFAGIPREGVGFSRNPVLRFGPPSFKASSFTVAGAPVSQEIRLKYFL